MNKFKLNNMIQRIKCALIILFCNRQYLYVDIEKDGNVRYIGDVDDSKLKDITDGLLEVEDK